ncbi:MAG: hypothetical protein AAB583_03700 [Patescibacteria group bacterium]
MFSKNNPVVLLLDRSGFSLFQGTLVNILKFPFTPDTVANLEVVNKDQLFTLISSFIDKNRIYPSIIIVVLADAVVYEKDFSKVASSSNQKTLDFADKEQQQIEIQNFLQKVPFEEILAKVIKTEAMTRLVAANKDLIFSTTDPFAKKGFLVEAIVPAFLYGQNANFANGLTPDIARLVLKKQELLKVANLLIDQQETAISQGPDENEKGKEPKRNLMPLILIAIFIVLLIVLGIMFVGLGGQEKSINNNEKKSSENRVIPSITPIPVKSDTSTGSSSATLNIENITITIIQNSQSIVIARLLKEALETMGFRNIISENSKGAIPVKSTVLFSKNIPTILRENAILEINEILPSALVLETENSESKITIILGQS